jgi:hypothetical protein
VRNKKIISSFVWYVWVVIGSFNDKFTPEIQMQTSGLTQKVSQDSCASKASISLKCLMKHNNDTDICEKEVQAYKDCRQTQIDQRRERRLAEQQAARSKKLDAL